MEGAGTLPDRWALAAGRAATKGCNICHGPRLPGARLCAPCKAALKRARLETVSELIPRPSRAAAEEAARRRAKARAAAQPAPSPRWWLIIPGLFLALAAIVTLGYLALHLARRSAEAPAVTMPLVASRSAPPAAVLGPRIEPAAPSVAPEAKPAVEAPGPHAPPRSAAVNPARLAQKRVVEAPPVPNAMPVDRFASATEPVVPAPVAAQEVVPPIREAPAPDRWQVMVDQIARCGRDGFLAGVICEQRVRLKYCDGYWGQVAQCQSGLPNDHGR